MSKAADLDCDGAADAVWRADLVSFATPQGAIRALEDIVVQPFPRPKTFKNVILYIGGSAPSRSRRRKPAL